MAKLQGVKTLDMTNGEVTKVEYNGEVYAKVDGGRGSIKPCDILLNKTDKADAPAGNYYEVTEQGSVYDDVGALHMNILYDCFIFRKVNAAPYALVTDREPKAGDFVKFLQEFVDDDTDLTAGKYYEITRVRGDYVYFDDDENDERVKNPKHDGVEVYEKVGATPTETLTHNGATYTLVDRKAQPGDVVVFTENTSRYVRNGVPYEVTGYNDGMASTSRVIIYREDFNRTPANVKVYEPQVAPVATEKPLQVGDYAKVVNDDTVQNAGTIPKDTIVEIVGKDSTDIPYRMKSLVNGKIRWAKADHIVKATDEEVAKAKATLQVGDYVRTLTASIYGKLSSGTIGKITKIDSDGEHLVVPLDDEDADGYYVAKDLEKLSEEEVEQHRAEQAELSRWAAIGRRPNEFKAGDIAKLITSDGSIYFGEISSAQEGSTVKFKHLHVIRYGTTTERTKNLTLITPVEQRFDLTEQSGE
ncbi:hypothetical protein [Cytobacillus solani]|uniref:Uncharacterized protein n=1 Tax=Cytobacillus solani TaxID=1637975 RepID=A0A0Q3QMF7_9BACI|nr:hypothetical protein [Cytobacillus solani]KQL18824.1 hypothetical protein AN957_09730 [Cytobacillus solani]